MTLIYDEWYGELSYNQRAAYRKHNISPSDHEILIDIFGEDSRGAIVAEIRRQVADGSMFSVFNIEKHADV